MNDCLYELAADLGRLKRRHPDDWAIDRAINLVQTLFWIHQPTAAELAAQAAPGDEQAVTEAIRIVDEQQRRLEHLLGVAK